MSYRKDQQQEFRELVGWVIDQTRKAGADNCKVSISKRRFVEINYRDRKPEVIKEATTQGLSLDVYINNRFANQSTPDFRKSTLAGFITDLIDTAKIMEDDPSAPSRSQVLCRQINRRPAADRSAQSQLTPEERHAMAKAVEDACLKQGGSKVISVEAGEYDETYEEFVQTSNGFDESNRTTECCRGNHDRTG